MRVNPDRTSTTARTPVLVLLGRAGQGALVLLCLGWAVYERPAPVVTVSWQSWVTPDARAYAERQLLLANPEQSDDVWQYELLSPRRADIRALVTHPAVRDTSHINRDRLTLSEPGVGKTRIWWQGPFKGARGRLWFRGVAAGLALLTVWCFSAAARTSGGVTGS